MSNSTKERRHSAAVTTSNSGKSDKTNDVSRRISMGSKIEQTYTSSNPPLSSQSKKRWSSDKSVQKAFVVNSPNFWKAQSSLESKQNKMGSILEKKASFNSGDESKQGKLGSWKSTLSKQQQPNKAASLENEEEWKANLFKRKQGLVNEKAKDHENCSQESGQNKDHSFSVQANDQNNNETDVDQRIPKWKKHPLK